jgi:hypothetical protein
MFYNTLLLFLNWTGWSGLLHAEVINRPFEGFGALMRISIEWTLLHSAITFWRHVTNATFSGFASSV